MTQAWQLIIVSPQQSSKGHIDERCPKPCVLHHISSCSLAPAHVSDLREAGEERNVGDSDEGSVRVTNTLATVEEVKFPERKLLNKDKRCKTEATFACR